MRNISDKRLQKIKEIFYVYSFFFKNRAIYELCGKNIVEAEGLQMTYNVAQKICSLYAV